MKVSLIVPGSKAAVENARYRELFPQLLPMSVACLASVLELNGHQVQLVDQVPSRLTNTALVEQLRFNSPDLIGISLLTTTVANAIEIAGLCRTRIPSAKIVAGHQHASLFPDELLSRGIVDYVVRGEGEVTLAELTAVLEAGKVPDSVAGVSYLQNGKVIHNPQRELIQDLDTLPYPAWHLVDLFNMAYMELPVIGVYSTPIAIMASRGCPYNCVFCSQDKQYKQVRLRDVNKVVDEIEYFADKFGVEWFTFNDAYFPWTKEQGMAFADQMIRRGLHRRIRWTTESRVDRVDDELMRRLKEAGLAVIFFGFESGTQAILDRAGKQTTLEQARSAARATREAGVALMGFFMLGLPGETLQTAWETVDFAIELNCDFAKFAITIPYPGSRLYDQVAGQVDASQSEKFTSWTDWAGDKGELLYVPDGMTTADLLRVQRLGMLKFYARPQLVYRHLINGTLRPRDMLFGASVLLERAGQTVWDRLR